MFWTLNPLLIQLGETFLDQHEALWGAGEVHQDISSIFGWEYECCYGKWRTNRLVHG